ncbi:MAG: biotin attachment protein [Candidatus Hecatellales archaeon]|nr:MAG: biotin attachment protein [Candidatus Hecatellales archaeon]
MVWLAPGESVKYLYMPEVNIRALNPNSEMRVLVWAKEEGEMFTKMEPVLYVETEIGVIAVQAPQAGILRKKLVKEGMPVKVGQILAFFTEPRGV